VSDSPADIADYLADAANAVRVPEVDRTSPRLTVPGLYSWWADDEARTILGTALDTDLPPLIYAGQAGATTSKQAITRSSTLRSRIVGQHLRANTRGSTFSLTLAACLHAPLGLTFTAPRQADAESQIRLATWMATHLSVATYPVPDPTHLAALEEDVLAILDPPLNLMGMAPTLVRSRLSTLRAAARPA
jgi:hypothetical protein